MAATSEIRTDQPPRDVVNAVARRAASVAAPEWNTPSGGER